MLIPCIDLQGGQAVQLVHGRRRELAVADVFGLLDKFRKYPWLHIIDLDAAMGKPANDELVHDLCVQSPRQIQNEGASRRRNSQRRARGRDREIGRRASHHRQRRLQRRQSKRAFLPSTGEEIRSDDKSWSHSTPKKGRIVTNGWRRKLKLRPETVMAQLEPFCAAFLCTDVDREGTMTGANLEWFNNSATPRRIPSSPPAESRRAAKSQPWKKSVWTPPWAWPSTRTAFASRSQPETAPAAQSRHWDFPHC